ncbi:hypothetical protein NP493_200g02022 [Ridgeia piscesae]|uniref:Phosphatidylethanolamine-binding protein n=1 Tax=Ridgeia piscesae TaxID=27915 RepID=A0AAD9P1J1_RIDPI|nr:hypothetical protein NP493_200g02022 [Ridgeia piscesae]
MDPMDELHKEMVGRDLGVTLPTSQLKMKYGSLEITPGQKSTPTQVKNMPLVEWSANPDNFYTLVMCDPDAPSRNDPTYREWLHWCVGNIPGVEVSKGQVLAAYIGAGPPKATKYHRYVFLVYRQSGRIKFDEPILDNRSGKGRGGWHVAKFAEKYKLGDPVAGNFFQAEYDDYVPHLFGK